MSADPAFSGLRNEIGKAAPCDRLPQASHEILIIGDVDLGEQHHTEDFARLEEVVQISSRIVSGGRAGGLRIERRSIFSVTRIHQIHLAKARIGQSVPPGQ